MPSDQWQTFDIMCSSRVRLRVCVLIDESASMMHSMRLCSFCRTMCFAAGASLVFKLSGIKQSRSPKLIASMHESASFESDDRWPWGVSKSHAFRAFQQILAAALPGCELPQHTQRSKITQLRLARPAHGCCAAAGTPDRTAAPTRTAADRLVPCPCQGMGSFAFRM